MRHLGQLGTATHVAATATSTTRREDPPAADDVARAPGITEERAAAWRAWAAEPAPEPVPRNDDLESDAPEAGVMPVPTLVQAEGQLGRLRR